jgi:peptidoglycan hydrolase CwlO-like protein
MTDNYTSAEMRKLIVKDVHFSVGITDYNGWPTVTIKAPNGQEQWYVPSNDMNYMKKKDAKYERQDRELAELRRQFSGLMDDKQRIYRFALDWKEQLDESTKKLEQANRILEEASQELVQINRSCDRRLRVCENEKKELIAEHKQRYELLKLKMQDEIQIAVNRCRREAKG